MSQRLQELLAEIRRREQEKNLSEISFIDQSFPKQREILLDESRFQLWNCTRRGAKSNTAARAHCSTAWKSEGSESIYMALTLDSAKAILWEVIESLLDEKKIRHKPYKQPGIFEIEAGVARSHWSKIRFFGVDASYREMRKILGRKLKRVSIDEAGSITVDMQTLVYQMITPALTDLDGFLTLLGTCENIPNTFFESVLKGKDAMSSMWKRHIWTTYENPYMAKQWDAEVKRILEANPLARDASWFRTHYLNEWCADDDLLIIKHRSEINEVSTIPHGKMFYCLGVDLGFNDASSFTVCAYSNNGPDLYVLRSFKSSGMDFTDVAVTIKKLQAQYDIHKIIVDGANKQGVEELQKRHSLALVAAEKTDKETFLRALSDDYKQGRIKVLASESQQLIDEQSQLMWLKDANREDPRCENHCNDSLLYAWRDCKNYMFEPEVTEWKSETQRMKDQERREAEELAQALKESEFF
jgi:hypothetical protein